MYCVKCKKATDTTNKQLTASKIGRNMKLGTCIISKRKWVDRC